VDIFDYSDVPLLHGDLKEVPESVLRLKQAIEQADAILIATPEFNDSIPGVLKNALDWGSRPAYHSPFRGKPVGILSASPSALGGVRAQQHLKTILLGMAAAVFPWPEVAIAGAHHKVEGGVITDERTRQFLSDVVMAVAEWAGAAPAL